MGVPVLFALIGMACSPVEGDYAAPQEKQSAAKPAPDHVWKAQTQTLDKAKSVEGVLLDSARQRDQALQQQAR